MGGLSDRLTATPGSAGPATSSPRCALCFAAGAPGGRVLASSPADEGSSLMRCPRFQSWVPWPECWCVGGSIKQVPVVGVRRLMK